MANLTAMRLKQPMANGRHRDGEVKGLYFRVVGDSRSWMLRVVIDGKRCDLGLGSYPDVGLADAREKARAKRTAIAAGINPLAEKRAKAEADRVERAKAKTFEDCAAAYIEDQKAGWKNEKHAKQWTATLETYAYPKFGKVSVASVDTALVLEVLRPLWGSKTETASRLRGRIEKVLDWAKVSGYCDGENPARWRGHLDKILKPRAKVQKVEHHAALPYAHIGGFMTDLRKRDGMSARALEFAILTAARSGEVRGATIGEFDLDSPSPTWTIPRERMKADKEHRIPLAPAAVALLKALPKVEGSKFVFPAPRGGALSDMALTAVLKRMDRDDLTAHGFRSTFRDWAGEQTAYPREVIEHALAHQLKDKAEAAYQRGDLLEKRARLMDDWAKRCAQADNTSGNVVAIKGAA